MPHPADRGLGGRLGRATISMDIRPDSDHFVKELAAEDIEPQGGQSLTAQLRRMPHNQAWTEL